MRRTCYTLTLLSIFVSSCINTSIDSSDSEQFIRFYGLGLNDQGIQVLERQSGGAIILAEFSVPDKGKDIGVVIVDEFGNLAYPVKLYGGIYDDIPYRIVKNPAGGYFILSTTHRTRNGNKDVSIYAINERGDSIWNYIYGSSKNDEGFDMILAADGNLVVTGYTAYDRLSGSEKLDEVLIAKFSTTGDSIFFRNYGSANQSERGYFIRERKNGFLVAATTNAGNTIQPDADRHVVMVFADAFGQGKFHQLIDTIPPSTHLAYLDIVKDTRDTLQYILAGDINQDGDSRQIFISSQEYCIENSFPVFKTKWFRTFDFTGNDILQGGLIQNNELYLFGSSNRQALIMSVNESGNQVSKMVFGSGSQLVVNSICVLNDNSVLTTGSKTTGENKVLSLIKKPL